MTFIVLQASQTNSETHNQTRVEQQVHQVYFFLIVCSSAGKKVGSQLPMVIFKPLLGVGAADYGQLVSNVAM